MIPTADHGTVSTSGKMQTNAASIEMTAEMFDLMSSKIYTDKPLAVIREILCNAKDAHKLANKVETIQLHLPNRLEPFLHIRDYGPGLSTEDVMNLYLKYGYSTKKKSNDYIGAMGIGSKSPLAYTDSFIVHSYFEGHETTYNIYKDQGIPQVAKLVTKVSSEPNGMKIKMSVAPQDFDTFRSRAEQFLRFFDNDVEVVGSQVDYSIPIKLDKELYKTYDTSRTRNLRGYIGAFMGGIVYDISHNITNCLDEFVADHECLILKFDIGDISMAASREALSEDPETTKILKERVKVVQTNFYKDMQILLDKCTSPYEARKMLGEHNLVKNTWGQTKVSLKGSFTWNGNDAREVFATGKATKVRTIIGRTHGKGDHLTTLEGINTREGMPIILQYDRKTGGVKLAKALSLANNNTRVLIVEPADQLKVEEYFGKLTVKSIKAEYPIMFPKGSPSNKVSVAKSGLFDINMKEIKELDPTDKGVYIPFERDDCIVPGIAMKLDNITTLLQMVDQSTSRKDKTSFYICRKGGLPAVRKTQIVECTLKELTDQVKDCYTAADYDMYTSKKAEPDVGIMSRKELAQLWPLLEHEMPLLHKFHKNYSKRHLCSTGFLHQIAQGFIDMMIPNVQKDIEAKEAEFTKEFKYFRHTYKLISVIPYYEINNAVYQDLVLYIQAKQKKAKISTQVVAKGSGTIKLNK